MDFEIKSNYSIEDLLEIMSILRSPNGCPWDKEQTHMSIRQNFIEETYEAIEAIDNNDKELLREELGDVLLQVVFHCKMEEETQEFNFDDVVDEVCKKLIIRHPHIFSDVKANTTDKVLNNWEKIKMQTKSHDTQAQAMDSVARSLPSLMRSQKLCKKSVQTLKEIYSLDELICQVQSNLDDLKNSIDTQNKEKKEEKIGKLLFSVVNVSQFIQVDAEKSLYDFCEQFINRFYKLEKLVKERNIIINKDTSMEVKELWELTKEV